MFKPISIVLLTSIALVGCQPSSSDNMPTTSIQPQPTEPLAPEAPPPTSTTPVEHLNAINWQCGDVRISTEFKPETNQLMVNLPDKQWVLPQVESASGAHYDDGKGNAFWDKGDEATITYSGGIEVHCNKTANVSPWEDAKSRGVAFRAIGNEPSWWVEVDKGETPLLRGELNYAGRKIDLAKAVSLPNHKGFSGEQADGTKVNLEIIEHSCTDSMSGQTFSAAVQLSFGGEKVSGCGQWLSLK